MSRELSILQLVLLAVLAAACDETNATFVAETGAGAPAPATTSAPSTANANAAADAGPGRHGMPPRPVPTSSPTVSIGMPIDVQLQAIQYMAAMQAPQPGDAPADPTYANQIAAALKPMGKTDVISSGRLIELKVDKGCDATMPKQIIARSTSAPLGVLLAHGVLVIKCLDRQVQCLQSTRDADDVLCTHK
jgi:hypothetical protein